MNTPPTDGNGPAHAAPSGNATDRRELELIGVITERVVFYLAHELRTPLAALMLWSKILNTASPGDPQQLREGLGAIDESIREQEAMIGALIDISRILSSQVELAMQAVDVGPLLKNIAASFQPAAAANGLRLEVHVASELGPIMADETRLQQAVQYLLGNALKFTPRGGQIRLEAERSGAEIEIRVKDTGAGIASDRLEHLFDRLSPVRPHGGLGVSLLLTRRLIELHHGTIAASSPGPGGGATFTLRLPLP